MNEVTNIMRVFTSVKLLYVMVNCKATHAHASIVDSFHLWGHSYGEYYKGGTRGARGTCCCCNVTYYILIEIPSVGILLNGENDSWGLLYH